MSDLAKKIDKLDTLIVQAGWPGRRLFSREKEHEYRRANGLVFDFIYEMEDSGHGDGGYRITGRRNLIYVQETGLCVYNDGWKVDGPWTELAEPSVDGLIAKLEALITQDDAEREAKRVKAEIAEKAKRADLIELSIAAFRKKDDRGDDEV